MIWPLSIRVILCARELYSVPKTRKSNSSSTMPSSTSCSSRDRDHRLQKIPQAKPQLHQTTPDSVRSTVPPPLYQGHQCREHPHILHVRQDEKETDENPPQTMSKSKRLLSVPLPSPPERDPKRLPHVESEMKEPGVSKHRRPSVVSTSNNGTWNDNRDGGQA
jgi:hypothetical protein